MNESEVIERIKNYIQNHPDVLNDPDRWIEGMGWDQTKWTGKNFPTAVCSVVYLTDKSFLKIPSQEDLDQDPLLKGRPISLNRVDGHARWVSSRVLKLMGDLPGDSEVIGGKIIRDNHGNPTGMKVRCSSSFQQLRSLLGVFVDNAMNLIPSPPWTHNQMEEYFSATMNLALQYGLTSIHDADTKLPMIDFFKRFDPSVLLLSRILIILKGRQKRELYQCV